MSSRLWLIVLAGAVRALGADSACSLVTAAEATVALGAPVSAGEPTIARSGSTCRYGPVWPWDSGARVMPSPRATLIFSVSEEHSAKNYQAWRDGALQNPGATPHTVAGLGERAVFIQFSGASLELLMLTRGRLVRIVLAGRPCAEARPILSRLARKVAE